MLTAIRISAQNSQPVKFHAGIYGGFSSLAGIDAGLQFKKIAVNIFSEYNLQKFEPSNVTGLSVYSNFNKNGKNSGLVCRVGIGDKKMYYSSGYYLQIELGHIYIRPQFELSVFRNVGINCTIAAGTIF